MLLISLKEIMQRFRPEQFARLMRILTQATVMRDTRTHTIDVIRDTLELPDEMWSNFTLPTWTRVVCQLVAKGEPLLKALGFVASLATLTRMNQLGQSDGATEERMVALAHELMGRLDDELSSADFMSLTPREAMYYRKPREGWEQIIERFPDAITDVEEAMKCFALSRYPAAVFHSLQIVEMGLIDLGTFIGVSDPLSGWTAVSRRLGKIIDAKYESRTQFERDNFAFIEQLHGTVEALKNAWRNKVSHAQGKLTLMTADMSPEVAEEILYACGPLCAGWLTGFQ